MSTTTKSKFQTASIIHWALTVPMVLFGVFCYYKNTQFENAADTSQNLIIYLPLVLMVVAIMGGRVLYNNTLKDIKDKTLDQKLQYFITAIIIRGALFEMAGVTAGVASFLTGNNTILLLIPIVLLQFYINRPTLLKIEIDLKASKEELDRLKY